MDYKRQTSGANFTKRVVEDKSKQLYETSKAITKRDQNFVKSNEKANIKYDKALDFWNRIADRPHEEIEGFWKQVNPAIKQFVTKDAFEAVEFKQDLDFDKTLKDLQNETIEQKTERRKIAVALLQEQENIDWTRTGIIDWANKNGYKDYATYLNSLPIGGRTAVIQSMINDAVTMLPSTLSTALAGTTPMYKSPVEEGKLFSGSEIFEKENPALWLKAMMDQETSNFYKLASANKLVNRKKIAELVDNKITPIFQQFELQTLNKIQSANATKQINKISSQITSKLTFSIISDGDDLEVDEAQLDNLTSFLETLPQKLRVQVGLQGTDVDVTGATNSHIAVAINRYILSLPQAQQAKARNLISEMLGAFNTETQKSKNTVYFTDNTTQQKTTYAEKWPGTFGINGTLHTHNINGHTLYGSQSGSTNSINALNNSSGATSSVISPEVEFNQALTEDLGVGPSAMPFTFVGDADLNPLPEGSKGKNKDRTIDVTINGQTQKVKVENIYVVDRAGNISVNPKAVNTWKGKFAAYHVKGEPVPDELIKEFMQAAMTNPQLRLNPAKLNELLDFARAYATPWQTNTILNKAWDLKGTSESIISGDNKILKSDLDKLGLNNDTAMQFFKDKGITIVDYIPGEGEGEKLEVRTAITNKFNSMGLKFEEGHDELLTTDISKAIFTKVTEAIGTQDIEDLDIKQITENATTEVLGMFQQINDENQIGNKWYVNDDGEISKELLPKGFLGFGVDKNALRSIATEKLMRRINKVENKKGLYETNDKGENVIFKTSDLQSVINHIRRHKTLPENFMEAISAKGENPYLALEKLINSSKDKVELKKLLDDTNFATILENNRNINPNSLFTLLKLSKNQNNQYISNVALSREVDKRYVTNMLDKDGSKNWFWKSKFRIPRSNDMALALGQEELNFDDSSLYNGKDNQIGKYQLLESKIKQAFSENKSWGKYDKTAFKKDNALQDKVAKYLINKALQEVYNPEDYTGSVTEIPNLLRRIHKHLITSEGNEELDYNVINILGNTFIYNTRNSYSGGAKPSKLGLETPSGFGGYNF